MATLTVGAGKQFTTIAAAVAAAKDGDVVAVSAGTYVNDVATAKAKISLVAVGGVVTMRSTSTAALVPALLTIGTDATVNGFAFSGLRTSSGIGAGVLVQGGTVTIENSLFTGNQNGLVATGPATVLTIQASEFVRNSNNDGFSHNLAVGAIKSLTVTGSYIHDAVGGDEVRSLAGTTTITGTRIEDDAAASVVSVDLPNGGAATLQGDTIEKGAASTALAAVRFGGGTLQPADSLALLGNTAVSDKAGAVLLLNQTGTIASLSSNNEYGFATIASGPASTFADTVDATRPALSSAPVAGGLAPAVDYGRAGAVVASGHTLTVGPGQQFATLAAAVATAADGDTIDVAAGTYVNDTAVVAHKLIIEGVGGLARFVDTAPLANGAAQFVTTTDVTFRNIEIFGASTVGGTAAAIKGQGGNLTIVNSDIHDNQSGVVAVAAIGPASGPPWSGSVGIFDSEIAANGTPAGTGADVSVAEISTLTLQNDYLHDAIAAPEVVSLADNTILDNDRISQAQGLGGVAVSLPDGGLATITNTAIEKGPSSQVAPLLQVGGGTAHAGSTVTLSNDTLISDVTSAPTTFVASTGATTTLSGTSFVGGIAGSVKVSGGTNTGATAATGVSVATASPWGAAGAPKAAPPTIATPPGTGPAQGQLILDVSEDAWHGDARFTLLVDGASVGGTLTATASHAAGQTQTITIAGPFAAGAHTVVAAFTNSLGSVGAERALYVDAATFNGQDLGVADALTANGTALIETAPVLTPTAVAVNLSEDAWHGDALAFISIDGKVQGGVQTVTASHAAASTEALKFLLDLAPGPHSASVTFLNGVAGGVGASRDLYVDSIDVAGAHYAAAAASLGSGGTSAFAFTVAPPPAANGSLFVTVGAPQDLLPHAWR